MDKDDDGLKWEITLRQSKPGVVDVSLRAGVRLRWLLWSVGVAVVSVLAVLGWSGVVH